MKIKRPPGSSKDARHLMRLRSMSRDRLIPKVVDRWSHIEVFTSLTGLCNCITAFLHDRGLHLMWTIRPYTEQEGAITVVNTRPNVTHSVTFSLTGNYTPAKLHRLLAVALEDGAAF